MSMKGSSYRERDYAFGRVMLTLRTRLELTQTVLAERSQENEPCIKPRGSDGWRGAGKNGIRGKVSNSLNTARMWRAPLCCSATNLQAVFPSSGLSARADDQSAPGLTRSG